MDQLTNKEKALLTWKAIQRRKRLKEKGRLEAQRLAIETANSCLAKKAKYYY